MNQGNAALAQRQNRSAQLATGSYSDPGLINAMLDSAEHYNLVAPATACGRLPEGFEVVISCVRVNPDAEIGGPGEVYATSVGKNAKYGLSKSVLDQIASALGVTWDAGRSGRLDDGRDPRYCHWRTVGHVQNFDGTWRTILGEKEMDLRDGSPQVQAIIERVEANNKKNPNWAPKSPDGQIREMRLHIMGHAETKARLRAIRSMGIKTSYTPDELRKPFAVARLMATGHSNDPTLRREFARMQFAAGLDATTRLFGAPTPALPQQTHVPTLHAPPPLGAVGYDPDDDSGVPVPHHPDNVETQGEPVPKSEPRQSAPRQAAARQSGGHVIPGGKAKGTPLSEATDNDLNYWGKRIRADLEAGNSRNANRDSALCDAIFEEIANRAGGTPTDDADNYGEDERY